MLQKTDRDECEGKVTRTTKEREKKKKAKGVLGCFSFSASAKLRPNGVWGGWEKTHKKNKDGKQIESYKTKKKSVVVEEKNGEKKKKSTDKKKNKNGSGDRRKQKTKQKKIPFFCWVERGGERRRGKKQTNPQT